MIRLQRGVSTVMQILLHISQTPRSSALTQQGFVFMIMPIALQWIQWIERKGQRRKWKDLTIKGKINGAKNGVPFLTRKFTLRKNPHSKYWPPLVLTQWNGKWKLWIFLKRFWYDKHCQRHSGPKTLSTLTQSTPLVQSRSFKKFWNLGQTSAWFCLTMARGEKNVNNF